MDTDKDAPLQHDDLQLAGMGYRPELRRQFSTWALLGLAFAVLNSWTALSASLSISLTSGGSSSVVWGLVTAGFCNFCIASSLAEFLSAYPTAGGQYHWVAASMHIRNTQCNSPLTQSIVAWPKWVPILSWITGWINVAGWVALVATNSLLSSQLIVGIISAMHPVLHHVPEVRMHSLMEEKSYEPERWHQFLIYIGLTLGAFVINAFMNSALPVIYRGAFSWSIGGFLLVSITALACASPDYNTAQFVFANFVNTTGWPDGIAWLLGLLQGGLGVTAFDSVAHMIEEVPNASVQGPKIMMSCVGIGTFTGCIFLIVLLFVAGDMDQVTTSAAGPLLQILIDATQSKAGAICLLMLPLVCLILAILSVMTTSSRLIFAFARDGGLPASRFFARVHPRLELPLNALILTVVVVICFGCIFLGSSSAFNAIIAASVVSLDLSYMMPILVNCLQGRNALPERKWNIPRAFGWIADIVSLSYIMLTTVLFVFPPSRTVTGSSMNYCVAAFAVIIMISVFQWIVDGRKNFTGPRVNVTIDGLNALPSERVADAVSKEITSPPRVSNNTQAA
ncbi:amino acid/polyamine transporter I [Aspergillus aurantiobrunneus]